MDASVRQTAATDALDVDPGLVDKAMRTTEERPARCAETFAEAEHDRIDRRGERMERHTERDGGVGEPRPVQMDVDAVCVRYIRDCCHLIGRHRRAASGVGSVFEAHQASWRPVAEAPFVDRITHSIGVEDAACAVERTCERSADKGQTPFLRPVNMRGRFQHDLLATSYLPPSARAGWPIVPVGTNSAAALPLHFGTVCLQREHRRVVAIRRPMRRCGTHRRPHLVGGLRPPRPSACRWLFVLNRSQVAHAASPWSSVVNGSQSASPHVRVYGRCSQGESASMESISSTMAGPMTTLFSASR